MKTLNLLLITFAFIFFVACGKKDQTGTTGEAIKFKVKEVLKSYKDCKPDPQNCSYFRMKYPDAIEGKVKDTINPFITKHLLSIYNTEEKKYNDLRSMSIGFIESYTEFKKKEPASTQNWYLDVEVTEAFKSPKILTLKYNTNRFEGGEHPLNTVNYYSFNLDNGALLSVSSLLKKDFAKDLNKLIDKKFREMKKLGEKDDLTKAELLKNEIAYTENFAITNDGLEFNYNAAEIAPYSEGAIIIKLNKEELKNLLAEDSLLK